MSDKISNIMDVCLSGAFGDTTEFGAALSREELTDMISMTIMAMVKSDPVLEEVVSNIHDKIINLLEEYNDGSMVEVIALNTAFYSIMKQLAKGANMHDCDNCPSAGDCGMEEEMRAKKAKEEAKLAQGKPDLKVVH